MNMKNNHNTCYMENKESLLIDCTYINRFFDSSNSLVIYVVNLIKGFAKYSHFQIHILVWREKVAFIDGLLGMEVDKIIIDQSDLTISWRPYYRLTGFLPKKLRKEINERHISKVLHPFHYGVLFFFPHTIKHYGVIHDIFLYDKVKGERGKISYFIWHQYQKLLLKKFSGFISISKNTHNEFLSREGLDSEIVYNSIPFDIKIVEQPVKKALGKRYILDVNRFQSYKNAELLIRAFDLCKNDYPDYLYFKGDHDYEEDRLALETLVKELGMEDKVIFDMEYRTEGEMRYLYSHADLFVSPSLKEGFGWTPIEAAILKTPVLVSDIEVFREVSCSKLTTFDPHSPEDLAKHILDTLNNPPSDKEREEISNFFLERYSLKNQIEQLVSIMERDLKK